jgi:hypothetical protein
VCVAVFFPIFIWPLKYNYRSWLQILLYFTSVKERKKERKKETNKERKRGLKKEESKRDI